MQNKNITISLGQFFETDLQIYLCLFFHFHIQI